MRPKNQTTEIGWSSCSLCLLVLFTAVDTGKAGQCDERTKVGTALPVEINWLVLLNDTWHLLCSRYHFQCKLFSVPRGVRSFMLGDLGSVSEWSSAWFTLGLLGWFSSLSGEVPFFLYHSVLECGRILTFGRFVAFQQVYPGEGLIEKKQAI